MPSPNMMVLLVLCYSCLASNKCPRLPLTCRLRAVESQRDSAAAELAELRVERGHQTKMANELKEQLAQLSRMVCQLRGEREAAAGERDWGEGCWAWWAGHSLRASRDA